MSLNTYKIIVSYAEFHMDDFYFSVVFVASATHKSFDLRRYIDPYIRKFVSFIHFETFSP